ncbi:hypothetical protein AWB78_08266 [Caballeronia calidae]|uniref:Uncharacterized protein n=1 Tax=Caballeronia calidae TaxID=1777139 RepID=A0A158EJ36_9BURK|nr:hypothetical protein AWB78_08266 [Caballeronia calidae]
MFGISRSRVVPAFEQRVLLGQHELERMQRCIGLIERLLQQTREAFTEPDDGALVEQIGGVAEAAREAVFRMRQIQREIELGAGVDCGQQLQIEPWQDERFHRRVLQHEHDLEQRRAARVASR